LLNITAKGELKSPTLTINIESMVGSDNPMLVDTSRAGHEEVPWPNKGPKETKDNNLLRRQTCRSKVTKAVW
jgi:hypothetical protein